MTDDSWLMTVARRLTFTLRDFMINKLFHVEQIGGWATVNADRASITVSMLAKDCHQPTVICHLYYHYREPFTRKLFFKIGFEIVVFLLTHQSSFFPRFIPVMAKMKGAMENDPVKLLSESLFQVLGIIPDPFHADIDFSGNDPTFRAGKRKSEDIGIVIVFQVSPVQIQQIDVVAKNKGERFQPKAFPPEQVLQKGSQTIAL